MSVRLVENERLRVSQCVLVSEKLRRVSKGDSRRMSE